ncbi:peroxiredoxin [Oryzibacter oryziterrae]|uniref:peroxiredoxin n=1 Tax=Oryzibacter oryziterrae TaxID=2766474 RepID=UPI001F3E85FC|nr:peroxiredoxin [Oryzibacter oryziterrae]
MIAAGDKLPDVKFKTMTADGVKEVSTGELFAGKKAILVAVPGAFTPTCDKNHLPGFVNSADALKAKGVDFIAFTSVNDVFVMNAWEKSANASGKVLFLADGSAVFAKAIGADLDLTAGGLGIRSTRYAAIIEDGVVKTIDVEENPGQATCSAAPSILEKL